MIPMYDKKGKKIVLHTKLLVKHYENKGFSLNKPKKKVKNEKIS